MSPGIGLSPSGPAEFALAEIVIGRISVGNGMAAWRFAPFYYQRVHDHFKAPQGAGCPTGKKNDARPELASPNLYSKLIGVQQRNY